MLPSLILMAANGNQEVPRCLAPHTLFKSAPPVAGNWKFAWNIWGGRCNVSTATANLKQIRIADKASRSRSPRPACLTGRNNCCHRPRNHARDFIRQTGKGFHCVTQAPTFFAAAKISGRSCPRCTYASRRFRWDPGWELAAGPHGAIQTLVHPLAPTTASHQQFVMIGDVQYGLSRQSV